ncbi:MAG: PEP-CTERM sorting domain-containing protein [Pseudomonadota bacterium]
MKKSLLLFAYLSALVVSGQSNAMLLSFGVEYDGWWDLDGGGSLVGSLITDGSADDDGFIDLASELMGWEWSWSGNDFVSPFSISSDDAGAGVDILGTSAGFFTDGTPNLPDFADGLDQGIFVGGASGEFVLDLEFLFIEDNTVGFPFGGDLTVGDTLSTSGSVSVSEPRAVPEPLSITLLGLALPGALLVGRRRRR